MACYGSRSTGFQAMSLALSVTLTKTVARYLKMKLENTILKKSSLFFCTSFVCNPIYIFFIQDFITLITKNRLQNFHDNILTIIYS